jgi:hypothetical protein
MSLNVDSLHIFKRHFVANGHTRDQSLFNLEGGGGEGETFPMRLLKKPLRCP